MHYLSLELDLQIEKPEKCLLNGLRCNHAYPRHGKIFLWF